MSQPQALELCRSKHGPGAGLPGAAHFVAAQLLVPRSQVRCQLLLVLRARCAAS
jgi:hypothetical protein